MYLSCKCLNIILATRNRVRNKGIVPGNGLLQRSPKGPFAFIFLWREHGHVGTTTPLCRNAPGVVPALDVSGTTYKEGGSEVLN